MYTFATYQSSPYESEQAYLDENWVLSTLLTRQDMPSIATILLEERLNLGNTGLEALNVKVGASLRTECAGGLFNLMLQFPHCMQI